MSLTILSNQTLIIAKKGFENNFAAFVLSPPIESFYSNHFPHFEWGHYSNSHVEHAALLNIHSFFICCSTHWVYCWRRWMCEIMDPDNIWFYLTYCVTGHTKYFTWPSLVIFTTIHTNRLSKVQNLSIRND